MPFELDVEVLLPHENSQDKRGRPPYQLLLGNSALLLIEHPLQ